MAALVWHTNRDVETYLGTVDWADADIEVSLHGASYIPEVEHLAQADLSDELSGTGYTRLSLAGKVYNDTSDLGGSVEAVVTADDTVWPGLDAGLPVTAVLSLLTGDVLAHVSLLDDDGGAVVDPAGGGLRLVWSAVVAPPPPPPGGRAATTPLQGLGWSPARGADSTSVPAGLDTFATFIGSTPRALVTFAHSGRPGSYATQRQAIDKVTNPNLATWQVKDHPDTMHVLKMVLLRKGAGETLAMLAGGSFDDHWRQVGVILHNNGFDVVLGNGTRNVLCPGWEDNGDWYDWFVGNDPTNFRLGFDRAVLCMEAGTTGTIDFTTNTVTGGNGIDRDAVDVEFNLNAKGAATRAQVRAGWPTTATAAGPDVYDIEKVSAPDGLVVYSKHPTEKDLYWDRNWQLGQQGKADTSLDSLVGLEWILSECQERDLYFTVSEWGVLTGTDKVGDDNWHFIRDMEIFLEKAAATGRLLYHTLSDYVDSAGQDGRIRGGAFPLSLAKFNEVF